MVPTGSSFWWPFPRCAAVAIGRTSPQTLYLPSLASFDMAGYTPAHAEGFIRLFGLPLATAAHRGNGHKKEEPVGTTAGGATR